MTRAFDYVAFADTLNAKADTLSIYPSAYPTRAAVEAEREREREVTRNLVAPCDAPRCGWCGVLAPNHDPRCLEVKG